MKRKLLIWLENMLLVADVTVLLFMPWRWNGFGQYRPTFFGRASQRLMHRNIKELLNIHDEEKNDAAKKGEA